jgi:plasmid stabilization system protein ParE
MSVRVIRSRRAAAEIEETAAYLAEHSPPAAERFLNALARAYQMLSEHPELGAAGTRPGTRRLVVGSYIVSYRRRAENEIEVFAVRHARRRDARF